MFGVLDESSSRSSTSSSTSTPTVKSDSENDSVKQTSPTTRSVRFREAESDVKMEKNDTPAWPQVTGGALKALLKQASQSVQKDKIDDIEFYWQMPKDVTTPRAILFLAHGCNHAGSDWWPKNSETCPECLGLPEELAIVDKAQTKFRMVTVAMSSSSNVKCWGSRDGPRVAQILKNFQTLFPDVPTYALGASSGGGFVSSLLPAAMNQASAPLAGYISEIMPPTTTTAGTTDEKEATDATNKPAAVFITMPKDVATRNSVHEFLLQQTKVGGKVKQIEVNDHPINSSFFNDRIPAISKELSGMLSDALKKERLVDRTTLKLVADPRLELSWKKALAPILKAAGHDDDLEADKSPISEVMNVAYGMHEMTRDGVPLAFGWLLSMWHKNNVA
ncbi:hypothetical protein ACA910_005896 [Epithemia clementina (nom. ined.)]